TDGYYFDFDVAEPFTPDDLKAIQKKAAQIVKSGQTFNRVVVTEDEARERMANEPYKLELISDKGAGDDESAAVEVGAGGNHPLHERRPHRG
ncbi:threonine--tRNA ligase, partial [Burkholderia multivorans]